MNWHWQRHCSANESISHAFINVSRLKKAPKCEWKKACMENQNLAHSRLAAYEGGSRPRPLCRSEVDSYWFVETSILDFVTASWKLCSTIWSMMLRQHRNRSSSQFNTCRHKFFHEKCSCQCLKCRGTKLLSLRASKRHMKWWDSAPSIDYEPRSVDQSASSQSQLLYTASTVSGTFQDTLQSIQP